MAWNSDTDPYSTPTELLVDALAALRAAHAQLRTAPGNADCFVRAAQDSIADALAALR